MQDARSNPDFLNGVPELVVLRLLAQRPRYGYELVRAIGATSGGALRFGEGCIYPVLHKLEEQGHLASRREPVGGRTRVVYRVTRKGQGKLARAAANWSDVARAVSRILTGGDDELRAIVGTTGST